MTAENVDSVDRPLTPAERLRLLEELRAISAELLEQRHMLEALAHLQGIKLSER